MHGSEVESNLHFAVVALQMGLIDRDQFVTALNRWATDKSKPLDQWLAELGFLDAKDKDLMSQLVDRHLEKHEGDVTRSLEALGSSSDLNATIAFIEDREIEASLGHLSSQTLQHGPSDQTVEFRDISENQSEASKTVGGKRFRIIRPHAKGGLGQVYVARDEEIGRDVALKEIHAEYAENHEARNRFVLEAEINGNLEHPGIVPVYGLGTFEDGRPYYAMRFIEGDSLKEAVEEFHGGAAKLDATTYNFRLRQLLGRFIDVCDAMAYAHSRGVLHRDLKPANIMLGKYGETLIVDWGLARPAVQVIK